MRNILLSLVMVAVLVAGGVGGVFADWVEDDESGYCWTAGSLNLKIDIGGIGGIVYDQQDVPDIICESGLEPGDCGEETVSFHIEGDPASGYYANLTISGTCDNKENGMIEPEETAGDTTGGIPGMGNGELGDYLVLKLWCDDGDNIFQMDEHPGILFYGTFNDLMDDIANNPSMLTAQLDICTVYYLGIEWEIAGYGVTYFEHSDGTGITPSPADEVNQCMTDSLSGNIYFTVDGPYPKP